MQVISNVKTKWDIFLKCLGLYELAQYRSSENVGINAEIEGVLLLNLPKS